MRRGDLVGGGVAEAYGVELDGDRPVGHRPRVGSLRDEGLEAEDLEDPLEADEGTHHLDTRTGQRGQRCVQADEEQGERDHGAGVEAAAQGVGAAEPVDERQGQGGHEGQGGDERGLCHGRTYPDVPHPPGPRRELGGLVVRPPEQLDQGGARRREPLGHPVAHRGVEVGRLPLEPRHAGAHPARGHHEHRQQHEREDRDPPGDREHHGKGQQQRHHIADDTGKCVAEGALCTDHVVVEAG